ncbi:MAG: PUR family DNA/RNA-binding protein [Bacteroidales bacterium]|nr:PUR family DNA/RNA-binding protein [Bacteroidales bacterium]
MYRDDYDQGQFQGRDAEDVYSKPVRAGKRTYFFDVKSTKGQNDFYLTITESKRRNNPDGSFTFDKHKIFLYKEDFEKFQGGLEEAIEYIRDHCFNGEIPQRPETEVSVSPEDDNNF